MGTDKSGLVRVDWPRPLRPESKAGTTIDIAVGDPELDGSYLIVERVETYQFTGHAGTTLWLRKMA